MKTIPRTSLVLDIIGVINWGFGGLFQFDLVAALFGGQSASFSQVIYSLVGLAGLRLGSSPIPTDVRVAGYRPAPGFRAVRALERSDDQICSTNS